LLDIGDVTGKRVITTRLHHTVTIREENAAAALEVMSRFAINPKWLVYLPPTMSPRRRAANPALEHPREAFDYYRSNGVAQVVLQGEAHGFARRPRGVSRRGCCPAAVRGRERRERRMLHADWTALPRADVRGNLARRGPPRHRTRWPLGGARTDWVCLDAELMPWSVKAEELLRQQYAAVGAAARVGLEHAITALARAAGATSRWETCLTAIVSAPSWSSAIPTRTGGIAGQSPPWPICGWRRSTSSHGGDGALDKPHTWHMETLARLTVPDDPVVVSTPSP